MSKPTDDQAEPLVWIQLELIPLPSFEVDYPQLLLWWNPDERRIIGDGADLVLEIVEDALGQGNLQGGSSHFEITDPLAKPSELAAVLAQYFWVIPQPVKQPGLVDPQAQSQTETPDVLQ